MFIARNAYLGKAENFLRMYGTFTFGPGGAFHDIPWVIKRYGIVPEEVYSGLKNGNTTHRHAEMEAILESSLKPAKNSKWETNTILERQLKNFRCLLRRFT